MKILNMILIKLINAMPVDNKSWQVLTECGILIPSMVL